MHSNDKCASEFAFHKEVLPISGGENVTPSPVVCYLCERATPDKMSSMWPLLLQCVFTGKAQVAPGLSRVHLWWKCLPLYVYICNLFCPL